MAADVLYVTFDGVLQPLAFSQVARVVAGLGRRGLRYHLLSLETPAHLADPARRRAVDDMLRPAGVGWTAVAAASMGTPRRAAEAVGRMVAKAVMIARRERVRLIHARAYQGALVGRVLDRMLGLPYVFDARGYWIEERAGPGGWFSTAETYAMGKLVEQALFRRARAVVTLTELQATDVASGLFGPPPPLLEVIPTCADYDAFYLRDTRPAEPEGGAIVPDCVRRQLAGKIVIAIVGALNATYLIRETLVFAKVATEASQSVHLLVVSGQRRAYQEALASAGLARDRYTVVSVEHSAMPEWLQWIDWGLLFVPETAANRAKMPTKLAEFFASGVRPLLFGCNSDATRWVDRAGSGRVLRSTDHEELTAAAHSVLEIGRDAAGLRAARQVTSPHFSLSCGLDRYTRLMDACFS